MMMNLMKVYDTLHALCMTLCLLHLYCNSLYIVCRTNKCDRVYKRTLCSDKDVTVDILLLCSKWSTNQDIELVYKG